MVRKKDALDYHALGRRGKIEVVPTKPCGTQRELSLAYTPGVAVPSLEIKRDPSKVFQYTARGNLVAVITNGTAVLGLGKIGPAAAKPVMEGKAILFKRLADIDVFDLELNAVDPDSFIRVVQALEPTFGGINLEDVRSPDCFYIEERLRKTMKIPVFHDDQHGTAIISGAALINALDLVGKKISNIQIVFCGAGAAGIACAKFLLALGAKKEGITMVDAVGVVYEGRLEGIDPYKAFFAKKTKARTLSDIMKGADVFFGLSVKGALKKEMVKTMAKDPIIFAMANPDPEITPEEAFFVRKDIIMATGRSDYPNQVNNVLGFPFIFRGALDVAARTINEEMKIAASMALAKLAREEVPASVSHAYGDVKLKYGPAYIIPKPFDPRVLLWVAPAVAKAAMESGVARKKIEDLEAYRQSLEKLQGLSRGFMRDIINKARGGVGALQKRAGQPLKKIVFPEGEDERIIQAAQIIVDEGLAKPILLGEKGKILKIAKEDHFDLKGVEIVFWPQAAKLSSYSQQFYELRKKKGMTKGESERLISTSPIYFGCMMVRCGDADGLVCGVTKTYPETIRPALQVVKIREDFSVVAGLYVVVLKEKVLFFADTTVNIDPTAEQLAEIAIATADKARYFNIDPKVAMLSFSNFGATKHSFVEKVQQAVAIVKTKRPDIVIDGELMADVAVTPELLERMFPASPLKGGANILIFPDLQSGNIAYKLMRTIGRAEVVGPILLGMSKPVHVLQHNCDVNDIVNMTAITVLEAKS